LLNEGFHSLGGGDGNVKLNISRSHVVLLVRLRDNLVGLFELFNWHVLGGVFFGGLLRGTYLRANLLLLVRIGVAGPSCKGLLVPCLSHATVRDIQWH
jgi:hypothetical protein